MHVIPQQRRIPQCNMCQALAWRRHLGWFDLCSAQNTPMTNSESKYQLFAPHLSPDYLLLNYQNGREHSITVYFFPWSCFIIFWSSKRLSVRGMKAMWPVSVLLDDWSCGQS